VSTSEKLNSHTIADNHPLIDKTESIDTIEYETRETKQIYGYKKKKYFFLMSCTKLLEPGSPFNLFVEKKGKRKKISILVLTPVTIPMGNYYRYYKSRK